MSVKILTFLILLFKVFSLLLSVETAETNVSISSTSAATTTKTIAKTEPSPSSPAATNNGTNSSTSHHETGSLSTGNHTSEPHHNSTSQSKPNAGIFNLLKDNNGAVLRAFYVVVGVTAIVVVYFVIRSVRLRRKRSKTRKYGITGKNIDLEMTPLDQEDDEDDLTVFEVPKHSKR